MQLYSGLVRLAGSVMHEVNKPEMTPAEVIVLRAIHGDSSVVSLNPTRMDRRAHAWERARLVQVYGEAVVADQFGRSHMPLPVSLDPDAVHQEPYEIDVNPETPDYDDDDDGWDDDTPPAEADVADPRQTDLEQAIATVQAPSPQEPAKKPDSNPADVHEKRKAALVKARAAKAAKAAAQV